MQRAKERVTLTQTKESKRVLAGLMGKNNEFGLLYDATLFWSSTEDRPEAMGVLLKNTSEENLIIKSFNKEIGASVRCIKDYSKN